MHATIHDLTGDAVVFRDLQPCDPGLPRLAELLSTVGLPPGPPPRKRDAPYARVLLALAKAAQARRGGPSLRTLAVIGDTDNDRRLASFLREAGPCRSYGFIGEDRAGADAAMSWLGDTATATRWELVGTWAAEVERRGGDWARAVVFVDIDKTLLGPRGRTDLAVDDARVAGALAVARELLGPALDPEAFRDVYRELCRKEWHPFTLDNQDYVAATALLIAAGAASLERLRADVAAGCASFAGLLSATSGTVRPPVAALHGQLRERVDTGDPTPFKAFRRAELVASLERMGDGRITLCGVVFDLCRELAARGALLIAASDKPAESAIPSPELADAGVLPLHRMPARLG